MVELRTGSGKAVEVEEGGGWEKPQGTGLERLSEARLWKGWLQGLVRKREVK